MNTAFQIYEFMGCIYAGLVMGIFYAVLDIIRRIFGEKPLLTALLDLFFVLLSAVFGFFALYYLTYGRFAAYHYFGFLLGIAAYVNGMHFLLCKIFFGKKQGGT